MFGNVFLLFAHMMVMIAAKVATVAPRTEAPAAAALAALASAATASQVIVALYDASVF